MLRNIRQERGGAIRHILNEVLSLNAQESVPMRCMLSVSHPQ